MLSPPRPFLSASTLANGVLVLLLLLSGCTNTSGSSPAATELEQRANVVDTNLTCPPDMVGIAGGRVGVGEWDADLLERYAPDRVLPFHRFDVAPYCIGGHPFPGVPGLPWPVDGLAADDLPRVERQLKGFGRRLCNPVELTLAAAGRSNWRFPWHRTQRRQERCETDDERPTSLGSRPECRSPYGLWDLQVRSSWAQMTPEVRSALPPGDEVTSPGTTSHFWLWGATARDDTYYAPSNFSLHHHLPGTEALVDDGLRICSSPGEVSDAHNEAWNKVVAAYPETASYKVLLEANTQ